MKGAAAGRADGLREGGDGATAVAANRLGGGSAAQDRGRSPSAISSGSANCLRRSSVENCPTCCQDGTDCDPNRS